ncbi:MAG: phosphotransferase [Acidimicrobiia bacterium]
MRLRHGYTNRTRRRTAGVVEKTYDGADAGARSRREYRCLTSLADRLPVPRVIEWDASASVLTLVEMPGTHGQDMIEAGRGREVLQLLGSLLRELQELDPASVSGLPGEGDVIVHGDFGPQNVLIGDGRISALLDWEFAHVGRAIEDLAWAEWIVRMHHPRHSDELPELFGAAPLVPDWRDRHAAMVTRCRELLRNAERAGSPDGIALWQQRLRLTAQWTE